MRRYGLSEVGWGLSQSETDSVFTPEALSLHLCHSTEEGSFVFSEVTWNLCLAFWEFLSVEPGTSHRANSEGDCWRSHAPLPEAAEKMTSHSVTAAQRTGWPLGPHSLGNVFS